MRHAEFFEALGKATEGSTEWQILVLGHSVMRFFDDWCLIGPVPMASDIGAQWMTQIEALAYTNSAYANVFQDALHALGSVAETDLLSVTAPLLVYASLLEKDGWFSIAADVYASIGDALDEQFYIVPTGDDTLGFTRCKEGFMLRNAGRLDAAESSYLRSIIAANRAGDPRNAHNARIGLTNIDRTKGNFSASLAGLNQLLLEWEAHPNRRFEDALCDLFHARGAIKHELDDYHGAILDLLQAYAYSRSDENRDQILGDLGACAIHVGYHEFARNILNLVIRDAAPVQLKHTALVNLLYLALERHDETEFYAISRQIPKDDGESTVRACFHLVLAQGEEQFGSREAAMIGYRNASAIASRVGYAKIELEAIQHLRRLHLESQDTIDS